MHVQMSVVTTAIWNKLACRKEPVCSRGLAPHAVLSPQNRARTAADLASERYRKCLLDSCELQRLFAVSFARSVGSILRRASP